MLWSSKTPFLVVTNIDINQTGATYLTAFSGRGLLFSCFFRPSYTLKARPDSFSVVIVRGLKYQRILRGLMFSVCFSVHRRVPLVLSSGVSQTGPGRTPLRQHLDRGYPPYPHLQRTPTGGTLSPGRDQGFTQTRPGQVVPPPSNTTHHGRYATCGHTGGLTSLNLLWRGLKI